MSTMTFMQASDEIKKMLRGFRAIEQVSAAMELAGSVQNAVSESDILLDKRKSEILVVEAEISKAKETLAAVKASAKQKELDAQEKIARSLKEAEAEIASIIRAKDLCIEKKQTEIAEIDSVLAAKQAEINQADAELLACQNKIDKIKTTAANLAKM